MTGSCPSDTTTRPCGCPATWPTVRGSPVSIRFVESTRRDKRDGAMLLEMMFVVCLGDGSTTASAAVGTCYILAG